MAGLAPAAFAAAGAGKAAEEEDDMESHGKLSVVESKARQRFMAGSRAYRIHDYVTAVREFSKAIFLDKRQAQFYAARAKAYRELGDFKSSLVDYRVATRRDPENESYRKMVSKLIDMQGHLHLDAHSYLAAKHCFTQAIKEDKVVVSYWLHRAVANIHLQEWRAALSDVDRALGLDARNADAHVLRAKLYWKLGMLPQGNADMTAAVALDPGHPEVVEFEEARWSIAESAYQRAASLMLLKDSAGAILELHRALELAPDDVKYRVLRAAAYRQEGNFADSLRDIECAARTFREQLKEDTAGGGAAPSQDQLDNVEHPEISRQRNLTLNAVAILQHQRGSYGHALTLYNKVIQSETTMAQLHDRQVDPRFLLNRGDTYLKLSQLQQALADFHRAYDSDPSNTTTKRRLAVVHDQFGVRLFNDGLVAQAEVEFSTAIEYNPGVALFHLHRGNAAMYLQKMDLAYRDFKAALSLEPGNSEAAQRLSQFASKPRLSRALAADKNTTIARRNVNASVPATPSQRTVGGRRRAKGTNIWEGVRKRELLRSGAHSGWLLAHKDPSLARTAARTLGTTLKPSRRRQRPQRRGHTAPSQGGGLLGATRRPRTGVSTAGGSSSRRSSTRMKPFVGITTGKLVDPRTALSASSWLDPQAHDSFEAIGAGGGSDTGAGADWHPEVSMSPTRRSPGSGSAAEGKRFSFQGAAGGHRGSTSTLGGSFPPIRGGDATGAGGGRTRGAAATGKWGLGRLRAPPMRQCPSPVVALTSQWREHSMEDIRAEVLPQRPGAEWLDDVVNEERDYRTVYFEKSAAFAKKTAGKKFV